MIVENNWLTTNIKSRLIDKSCDFEIKIAPYSYIKTDFETACINVAQKIASLNRPIYIALSGGADSEYVVRLFKKLNIPFTAITVKSPGNAYEMLYAYLLYKELPDVNKVFIDYTEHNTYIKKFAQMVKQIRAIGIYSVPTVAVAEYVKEQNNNGILIAGENVIKPRIIEGTTILKPELSDYDKKIEMLAGFCEWDHYVDVLVDDNMVVPFFLYDINIVNAMVEKYDIDTKPPHYKAKLYGTAIRPKMLQHFQPDFYKTLALLKNSVPYNMKTETVYTKEEFLNIINNSS